MNQTLSNPAFSPRLLQTHFNAAVNVDKKQPGSTQPPEKLRTLLVGVHELNRHICVSGDITVCYRFQRSSDLRYAGFLISYRRMRATVQGGPGLHPTVDALEDLLQFLEPYSSPPFAMQTSEIIVCGTDVATLAADPAALSRLAITTFLSRTGLSGESLKFVPDESVGQQARVITKHWDLGDFNPRIFNAALEASIGIATIAYAHTPPSTQLYITLYTTIAIAVDDGVCTPEALFAFADRMYCGLPQLHPLLDRFVDVLNDTINHYPAIAAREIIRATFAYMDSTALEFEVTTVPLRPKAFSYVLAKRLANGIGRAYANFVWDKVHFPNYFTFMQAAPDMEMYFDQVNDILSFYKEELVGEKGNFISERGRATNRGTAGALFDTVDDAVTAVQNIRSILEGTKELVACEAAMEGYVAWHRMERRYKLADVLGTK